MKEHSEEFKNKIVELGRQIDSKLIYGNTELVEELYSVTPHFKGNMLKSTMKQLDVETTEDIPIDTEVNYQLGLLVDDEYEWLNYGNYIVYSSEKQEDKGTYKLVCYDKLLNSMKEYEGIEGTFPMTLREYLNAICTKIGIEFGSNEDNFANYDRIIPSDRYLGVADYTYRDVLDEIAQATGSMICLNSDDELVVKYINEGIDNYNTVEGTSFELDDASGGLGSSITQLEGNTTQNGTPTPTNPIPIYTVSGDNEVVVCGENRFNKSNNIVSGYTFGGTGNLVSDSGFWYQNYFIGVKPNTTYYFSGSKELNVDSLRVCEYTADKTFIKRNYELYTITTSANTRFIRVSNRNGKLDTLMISTSPITTYSPYNGNSYRVDFGGKNILPNYAVTQTINGITFTVNEDKSITLNGTSTAGFIVQLNNNNMVLEQGQYTLSLRGKIQGCGVYAYAGSNNLKAYVSSNNTAENWQSAFTLNEQTTFTQVRIDIRNASTFDNVTIYPQIEKGTVATEYSPYVSNPIELCKIGNYVDKLKRAEGKNLFDENTYNDTSLYAIQSLYFAYVKLPDSFKRKFYGNMVLTGTQQNLVFGFSNSYLSVNPRILNNGTLNQNVLYDFTNAENVYLIIGNSQTVNIARDIPLIYNNYKIMISENANEPYEPYGNNWYIEKNIKKFIFDGTQSNPQINTAQTNTTRVTYGNYAPECQSARGLLCNRLTQQNNWNADIVGVQQDGSNGGIWFRIDKTTIGTTVSEVNSWFASNNIILYIVLKNPTYETITNENLIQQLNNIQNIELIENLCYVDWVGEEKPDMTLKYYQGRTLEEINEEYLKDVNVDFGEKYGPVNSIVLSRSGESDNVYIQDEDSIEENGLHELKIVDNQLMNFNDRSDYLQGLLDKLDGLEYYINDYTSTGICYLELGDRYYVNIGNEIYSCIMFNDEIDVTLGIQELIHTDMPKETKTDYAKADKTDRKINQTYLIVDKQNQQIQTVVNEIGDRSEKQTTITQDIDGINSEVSNLIDITIDGETSDNHLVMDNISLCQPVELKVRPIVNSIEYIYPKSNRYPSGSLYSPTRYVTFRRTYIDTEDGYQEKTEDINYELPCDLLYLDSTHYDELQLDYNTKTCKVIKRVEYNSSGNLVAKQVIETLNFEYPYVEIRSGDYEIFIPGYTYAYIYVKLIKKNEYTTQFTTQVEVETQVKQTENEVMISVNQKVDEENFTRAEIVARINNDETSEAAIKADAISLEGYTTINGGFSVDTEGNASIANGSVRINEGGIQLANGRSIVGGNGMLTQFQYNGNGLVGHMQGANTVNQRVALYIPVYIPQNFIITEAKLFLTHTYAYVYEYTQSGYQQYSCYARNVKLYHGNMRGIPQLSGGFVDSIAPTVAGTVVSDFGSSSGKTFPSSSSEDVVVDGISEYLREGMQYLYLADYVNNPSDWVTASRMSGNIDATLYVTGYLQNNIE